MKIDCISDLHGYYPTLEGGDLLIIAGDLTARDEYGEYEKFCEWLENQPYKKKILVAGNHDNKIQEELDFDLPQFCIEYLEDSSTEFEGLKIFGSPWTKTFEGMNPHCKAFTCDTEEELAEKWALIPDDTEILITHSPPWGILDKTIRNKHVGSISLLTKIEDMKTPPIIWVWGHIHEQGGKQLVLKHGGPNTFCVNASLVNERYEPVNKAVTINLRIEL